MARAKITDSELEAMHQALVPLDTPERRQRYLQGRYPRSDATQDVNRRYRWDLLWAAGGHRVLPDKDLADAHIYTALRKIIPPLTD